MPERVGIVGVPPLAVITRLHEDGAVIFDLDEPQVRVPIDQTSPWCPRSFAPFCAPWC